MFVHRDQKGTPPGGNTTRIKWLLDHKIWAHPVWTTMPDDVQDMFVPDEAHPGRHHLAEDDGTWKTVIYDEGCIQDCWDVGLVFVNPLTEMIDDDDDLNTAFRIWLEAGPWYDQQTEEPENAPPGGWTEQNRWIRSHDLRLNCAGKDMAEALLRLADLIELFYNDDGTDKGFWPCESEWGALDACEGAVGDFCPRCGFLNSPKEDT